MEGGDCGHGGKAMRGRNGGVSLELVSLLVGRADYGDDFALVAAIDTEVIFIDGYDCVARVEFAHADETEIGQVGMAIGVAGGEVVERIGVAFAVERDANHVVA